MSQKPVSPVETGFCVYTSFEEIAGFDCDPTDAVQVGAELQK